MEQPGQQPQQVAQEVIPATLEAGLPTQIPEAVEQAAVPQDGVAIDNVDTRLRKRARRLHSHISTTELDLILGEVSQDHETMRIMSVRAAISHIKDRRDAKAVKRAALFRLTIVPGPTMVSLDLGEATDRYDYEH